MGLQNLQAIVSGLDYLQQEQKRQDSVASRFANLNIARNIDYHLRNFACEVNFQMLRKAFAGRASSHFAEYVPGHGVAMVPFQNGRYLVIAGMLNAQNVHYAFTLAIMDPFTRSMGTEDLRPSVRGITLTNGFGIEKFVPFNTPEDIVPNTVIMPEEDITSERYAITMR